MPFPFLIPLITAAVSALGSAAASKLMSGDKKKESDFKPSESRKYLDSIAAERRKKAEEIGFPIINLQSAGAPVLDLQGREQNYFSPNPIGSPNPIASAIRRMEGGEMEDDEMEDDGSLSLSISIEPEEQERDDAYSEGMRAMHGMHENPEEALNRFIQMFGADALQRLSQQRGPLSQIPGGGMVRGPGAGMDDMVTGSLGGNQKVLLSNDEFVIPADVVSGLGDGSSEAGARELYAMMDRVRKQRTGTTEQPKKLKKGAALPA